MHASMKTYECSVSSSGWNPLLGRTAICAEAAINLSSSRGSTRSPNDPPALHDEVDLAEAFDIAERVARRGHQIRELAGCQRTELRRATHGLGATSGRRF